MKIGDKVKRKKYQQDILFEIIDYNNSQYILRGVDYRLIADSEENDLQLAETYQEDNLFELECKQCLKGQILHLDGDQMYMERCQKKYKKLGLQAYCYYMEEKLFSHKVQELLRLHKPQLLVLTGHDALKKKGNRKNKNDYLHTNDFVEAIKEAREYEHDKDALIIFAGACQSYYELLLASGANFASSPARKNIHALDPVVIVGCIANTSIKNYVDLEAVINKTSCKHEGIGGIDTRGVARNIYPR